MSTTLNIERTVQTLKSIVDSLRCVICDKLDGDRCRYGCGHVACGNCVAASESCLLCLTPPGVTHIEPAVDQSLSRQIKNVAHLLDTFQTLFHVNVNRHHRLTEGLKLEKELFPECIQAPSKYFNPYRKSSISLINTSSKLVYPGELIASVTKMDSFNLVQDWLEKQDRGPVKKIRKPFSDLNINDLRQNQLNKNIIKSRADLILGKVKDNINNSETFKQTRSHYKTIRKKGATTKPNKLSFKKLSQKENINQITRRNETTESGIEVDVDTIVINDSQSEIVDKDKLAWLAVLEADQNINSTPISTRFNTTDLDTTNIKKRTKVPFFKKSLLHEVCNLCSRKLENSESKTNETFKPVSISIENNTFKTTITVSHCSSANSNSGSKSVSIQTDDENCYNATNKSNGDNQVTEQVLAESQDLFISSPKHIIYENAETSSNVQKDVVSDSDTSSGIIDSQIEVTALVHRSCENIDYGVLNEIDKSSFRRKRPRGLSPTSTNSSDKENYDPNRMKQAYGKKKRKF